MMSVSKKYLLWIVFAVNLVYLTTADTCKLNMTIHVPDKIEAETFFDVICRIDGPPEENYNITFELHNDIITDGVMDANITQINTNEVYLTLKSDVKYDQKSLYCCNGQCLGATCKKGKALSIGYKPKVTNMKVVILNCSTLDISWKEYNETFKIKTLEVQWKINSGEWRLCRGDNKSCTASGNFSRLNDLIVVRMNASNNLFGQTYSWYQAKISHIVKPNPVRNLNVSIISSTKVSVQFESPMAELRHIYRLKYTCLSTNSDEKKSTEGNVYLQNLVPSCPYNLIVKVKIKGGIQWSDKSQKNFTTFQDVPRRNPSVEGFQLKKLGNSNHNTMEPLLYIKPIPMLDRHGDIIEYRISILSNTLPMKNVNLSEGNIGNPLHLGILDAAISYSVSVEAATSIGYNNSIIPHRTMILKQDLIPAGVVNLTSILMGTTMQLSWERSDRAISYKWFMCKRDEDIYRTEFYHQCEKDAQIKSAVIPHWKTIVRLPVSNETYNSHIFGVSLDTITGSSGIHWSSCIFKLGNLPVLAIEVGPIQTDSVDLTLLLPQCASYSAQSPQGYAYAYNISWCLVSENDQCSGPIKNRVINMTNVVTLRDLESGRRHQVKVTSLGISGETKPSPPVYFKTLTPVLSKLEQGGVIFAGLVVVVLIFVGIYACYRNIKIVYNKAKQTVHVDIANITRERILFSGVLVHEEETRSGPEKFTRLSHLDVGVPLSEHIEDENQHLIENGSLPDTPTAKKKSAENKAFNHAQGDNMEESFMKANFLSQQVMKSDGSVNEGQQIDKLINWTDFADTRSALARKPLESAVPRLSDVQPMLGYSDSLEKEYDYSDSGYAEHKSSLSSECDEVNSVPSLSKDQPMIAQSYIPEQDNYDSNEDDGYEGDEITNNEDGYDEISCPNLEKTNRYQNKNISVNRYCQQINQIPKLKEVETTRARAGNVEGRVHHKIHLDIGMRNELPRHIQFDHQGEKKKNKIYPEEDSKMRRAVFNEHIYSYGKGVSASNPASYEDDDYYEDNEGEEKTNNEDGYDEIPSLCFEKTNRCQNSLESEALDAEECQSVNSESDIFSEFDDTSLSEDGYNDPSSLGISAKQNHLMPKVQEDGNVIENTKIQKDREVSDLSDIPVLQAPSYSYEFEDNEIDSESTYDDNNYILSTSEQTYDSGSGLIPKLLCPDSLQEESISGSYSGSSVALMTTRDQESASLGRFSGDIGCGEESIERSAGTPVRNRTGLYDDKPDLFADINTVLQKSPNTAESYKKQLYVDSGNCHDYLKCAHESDDAMPLQQKHNKKRLNGYSRITNL